MFLCRFVKISFTDINIARNVSTSLFMRYIPYSCILMAYERYPGVACSDRITSTDVVMSQYF